MRIPVAAFALLGAVDAAYAQDAPQPPAIDTTPIVVQGSRDREADVRSFIKELTPASIHGQLSRFEVPVCPKAEGISAEQAKTIANRIGLVARAVGVPVAGTHCTPNLLVFVTDDKPGLLQKL
jgi:hypothetical protein